MRIDLTKSRAEYFTDLTTAEILRQHIHKNGPITINNLKELDDKVVATKEGSLEGLLKENYSVDSMHTVDLIKNSNGRLIILPGEYRINSGDSREVIAYSHDSLVKLDVAHVKRAIMGDKIPKGKLSAIKKQQYQWSPEKVISTACDYLHDNNEDLAEKIHSAYSWYGKDNHRRVVSLYRSIQGAELRAFQDFAAFRLLIPTMRKELRVGKVAKTGYKIDLTEKDKEERVAKVDRYQRYLRSMRREGRPARDYIRNLDVSFNDLIEFHGRQFNFGGGQKMRVPSRSKLDENYIIDLTNIPKLPVGDDRAYSMVWELSGNCNCPDKTYRSNRRRKAIDLGNDENFFCPHEVASIHGIKKKYDHKKDVKIEFNPFVIPTRETMEYLDNLRYNTVIVEKNPLTERFTKRSLNHTEIENMLWKKVMADGYEASFTTDMDRFRNERYDPHLDLIRFD